MVSVIMLNVVMLNVIMLNVVMLSVEAPFMQVSKYIHVQFNSLNQIIIDVSFKLACFARK